jgi:hypothetical protein
MLVANRLGVLSFANLPLVFLYAGRNNLLLWMTNWSHSTFILLHRWVAAIATLQAMLHSLTYLYAYVKAGKHAAESKLPYWYWGIIGTLGMAILFPTSASPIRRKAYEFFLAWHIIISILVVAGCYWHIVFEFQHSWGYETWIIVTMVIWAFDRVARLLRVARTGVKNAKITIIDDEYMKVTIPWLVTDGIVYLYFPTLTWRIWENHPFSVASTMLPVSSPVQIRHKASSAQEQDDIEKHPETHSASARCDDHSLTQRRFRTDTTFYIRSKTGLTASLRRRSALLVLIEAGYHSHSVSSLASSPTLVIIVGGVGITAVLPHLRAHTGRVKVYWGCRTYALIEDVKATGALDYVEVETFVRERMCIKDILATELTRESGEIAVLISGPEDMTSEVRNTVGQIVRQGTGIVAKLFVESFGW